MPARALAITALFLVTTVALLGARSSGALHPPLPEPQAEQAALQSAPIRSFLERNKWTTIKALPLDQTHWRITFFNHGRAVLDASIGPAGTVDSLQPHPSGQHATGSNVAWSRPLMFGFALLFVLATAVVPLRRMRNLDAAVIAGGMLAVLLFYDARFVAGDTYSGAVLLAYLIVRCAVVARGQGHQSPSTPLYSALLTRLPRPSRTRVVAIITAALIGVSGLLTYTSTGISDVAFAGMAGATAIQRGHVPYGHVTHEVVHGDTYPPFTYLLYLPFSLASPVDNSFDDLQGALDLNLIALLAAAALAYVAGSRVLSAARDRSAGIALAIAWLACPGILLTASGGGNDVPTAALVMGALAVATMSRTSSLLLALATAAKLGPIGALLVWVASLRGQRRAVAAAIAVAVGVALLVLLLALGGAGAIGKMIHALAFQFRRGSFHCVWTQLGAGAGQQVFEAAAITFALSAAVGLALRKTTLPLRQLCALAASIVLALQLAANYWTFAYFAWVLPLILVALFPPVRPGSPRREPAAP